MDLLITSLGWTRRQYLRIRDLVSGDDLQDAQDHRSDEHEFKFNPGTGGGFPIAGGGGPA